MDSIKSERSQKYFLNILGFENNYPGIIPLMRDQGNIWQNRVKVL
jgi:hypothetical protein